MSLLIKALEKAEKGKAADGGDELTLEPKAAPAEAEAGQARKKAQKEVSQQAAATVFTAKTEPKKSSSSSKAVLAGVAIILILAVAGLQFYAYLNGLNKPEIVMARAPAVQVTTTPSAVPPAPEPEANPITPAPTNQQVADVTSVNPASSSPAVNQEPEAEPLAKAKAGSQVFATSPASEAATPNAMASSNHQPSSALQKLPVRSQQMTFGEAVPMSRDTAVKVTHNQPANGVNPNLLAAYQAFNMGDDAAAQRNYRQVLQSDVRNVDALLGMAAIAARQGRNNDAAGWYGKVLEVEPRNDVAQAAMVNVLTQADPVSSESRIKNLIAQQPEAAHLYASLGNLYAEQNQWPSAQQAYFQAFHFDQNNAEYAFNLAVSLEQLGKSGLALPYYQRALALLSANGASGIDRTQLESRIAKLQ